MRNVYFSSKELNELIRNLTSVELMLYNTIQGAILENPTIEYFSDTNLSTLLNVPLGSIKNAKTSLKQKGYMLLSRYKDDRGIPCIRVVLGKEQVELYNIGILAEISNLKAYTQLKQQFRLLDPKLTPDEQAKAVKDFNEYFEKHKAEFQ